MVKKKAAAKKTAAAKPSAAPKKRGRPAKAATTAAKPAAPKAAPKKRGRPQKIAQQMFVDMWNVSTNLNEVAETLGISKLSCSVRASNLRKAGIALNRFKRGRKKLKK